MYQSNLYKTIDPHKKNENNELYLFVPYCDKPRLMPRFAGPGGVLPIPIFPVGQQFPQPPRPPRMVPRSPQNTIPYARMQGPRGGTSYPSGAARAGSLHQPSSHSQPAATVKGAELQNSPNRLGEGSKMREKTSSSQDLFIPMQVGKTKTSIKCEAPVPSYLIQRLCNRSKTVKYL